MKYLHAKLIMIAIYIFYSFYLASPLIAQEEPLALYLTWKSDPTTTMVIDWHVTYGETLDTTLYYKQTDEKQWKSASARKINFPFSERILCRKEIKGLLPDTRYAFKVGTYGRVYYFETMPQHINKKPLMFAVGGDTYDRGHEARQIWMERMNRMVLKYNPAFILWGGDLAYADGKEDQVWRWYGWFDAIKKTLIDADGKVIPIIVTIGNHETNGSILNLDKSQWNKDATRTTLAPFFYQLLAFPGQPGYRALDFGDYLSILTLDTDHSNPIEGEQTRWLKKALQKRKSVPHLFPAYHVPAYPSVKPFDQKTSARVRKYWLPLFDRFDVPMAFEFHDHVYKRTPRIRDNKINSTGTLYIGDGGWGTQLKAPKEADSIWYLNKIIRERNVVLVSLDKDKSHIRAVNEFGQTIDEYPDLFGNPSFTFPVSSLLSAGGSSLSAELAKRSGKVYVDSDFSGYTNGGFGWFDNVTETACLEWKVSVENSDNFTFLFRYSYPGPHSGQLEILVNGKVIVPLLSFPSTGKENQWKKSPTIHTYLKKGENSIEIRSHYGKLAPRIDRMEVFPTTH